MRAFSLSILAACLLLAGCDRAQQAALALSGAVDTQEGPAGAAKAQTQAKPSPATSAVLEIGEWLELAGDRNKRILVNLHAAEPLPETRLQLASALATEINGCAQERAMRQAPGADQAIKRSVFEWAERQCARHMINQALLISGPPRAQELSEVAGLLDPSWSIPIVSPAG